MVWRLNGTCAYYRGGRKKHSVDHCFMFKLSKYLPKKHTVKLRHSSNQHKRQALVQPLLFSGVTIHVNKSFCRFFKKEAAAPVQLH